MRLRRSDFQGSGIKRCRRSRVAIAFEPVRFGEQPRQEIGVGGECRLDGFQLSVCVAPKAEGCGR
ncbi:MAG: hypothetical protein ACREIV_16735, partial [Planctomycetaceae bacterium]